MNLTTENKKPNMNVSQGIFSKIESLDPLLLQVLNNHVPNIAIKKLSKKKLECLYYLVRGKTAREIASILNISPRTVEHYLEDIKFKWGCCSKSSLIELGFQYFKSLNL